MLKWYVRRLILDNENDNNISIPSYITKDKIVETKMTVDDSTGSRAVLMILYRA